MRVSGEEMVNGVAMIFTTVTETEDMRNAGTSPVSELLDDGWIKPEDSKLLKESPDGNSFRMMRPKTEDVAKKRENDRMAVQQARQPSPPTGIKVETVITQEDSGLPKTPTGDHNG